MGRMNAQEYADVIRQDLQSRAWTHGFDATDSLAALDALVAEVDRLEGERDEAQAFIGSIADGDYPTEREWRVRQKVARGMLADGGQGDSAS